MDGINGYRGWRWIFILEGLASVIAGVVCFFCMPDKPHLCKFLTEDEKRYLELRQLLVPGRQRDTENDRGFDWKSLRKVLTDWQIYVMWIV